jgi:hypothetical protein
MVMMQQTDVAAETVDRRSRWMNPVVLVQAIVDGHLELRREIRQRARVHEGCRHPIVVVAGNKAPEGEGES